MSFVIEDSFSGSYYTGKESVSRLPFRTGLSFVSPCRTERRTKRDKQTQGPVRVVYRGL